MTSTSSSTIRQQNDAFRQAGPLSGDWLMTSGVQAEGAEFIAMAMRNVMSFTSFNADNDPHGEHDFGAFTLGERKLFWKIDYYDHSLTYGSHDPSDPDITRRVLTIMLAAEY